MGDRNRPPKRLVDPLTARLRARIRALERTRPQRLDIPEQNLDESGDYISPDRDFVTPEQREEADMAVREASEDRPPSHPSPPLRYSPGWEQWEFAHEPRSATAPSSDWVERGVPGVTDSSWAQPPARLATAAGRPQARGERPRQEVMDRVRAFIARHTGRTPGPEFDDEARRRASYIRSLLGVDQ